MQRHVGGGRLSRRALVGGIASLGISAAGLALLSGACELVPSRTQKPVPRIGYLSPGPREAMTDFVDPFLDGLRALGYVEGETITIDWRFSPGGENEAFADLAAELVRMQVHVIAARTTPATLAAMQATSTIPIVMLGAANPVEMGLVASLAKPGGNVTGMRAGAGERGLHGKRLELLRDVLPGLKRLVALVDATNPSEEVNWADLMAATGPAGVDVVRIDLLSVQDVEAAFEASARARADAIFDLQNPLLLPVRDHFAALALQHRLPAMLSGRPYVASGLLMSYITNFPAIQRQAATYVDRILKGASPADLPVAETTTFDFFVNVTTLQALGLTIPPEVAAQVTEWVQ
jgi:putative ABC transport system substrate-binding protein